MCPLTFSREREEEEEEGKKKTQITRYRRLETFAVFIKKLTST